MGTVWSVTCATAAISSVQHGISNPCMCAETLSQSHFAIPDCCLKVLKEDFSIRLIVQDMKCEPPQG